MQLFDAVCNPKNYSADPVVHLDRSTQRSIVALEIFCGYTLQHGCSCCRLGSPVSRSNTIFIQASDTNIADKNDPIGIRPFGGLNVDARKTLAGRLMEEMQALLRDLKDPWL